MNSFFKGCKRVIFHRALNDRVLLAKSISNQCREIKGAKPTFEGDLCWNSLGDKPLLYLRHPKYMFDSLSLTEIASQEQNGTLLMLEPILESLPGNVNVVIELKTGKGCIKPVLAELLWLLNKHVPGRHWIDSYSIDLLRMCHQISDKEILSLHTEWLNEDRLLLSAAQPRRFSLTSMRKLDCLNAISLRYHGSKAYMEKAVCKMKGGGFAVMISRALNKQSFSHALLLNPDGIYVEVDDFLSLAAQMDDWAEPCK